MSNPIFKPLLNPILPTNGASHQNQHLTWANLYGAALGLAAVEAAKQADALLVIVLEDQRQLQVLENEINYFLKGQKDIPVYHFPSWECLPYDTFSPHQDIISNRLKLLGRLRDIKHGIVLIQTTNLMQRLPPVDYVLGHSFSLQTGQRISLDELRSQFVSANYISVNQVISPGEFAVRGGLVDVYPMGSGSPFRLDLFDDELETIRLFNPDTQRSEGQITEIELLPAREFPMTDDGIKQFRSTFRRQFEGDPKRQTIYNEVSIGNTPAGAEFFFPLFFENTATLFDYLSSPVIFITTDEFENSVTTAWAETHDRFINANHDPNRKVLPPTDLYLNIDEISSRISDHPSIKLVRLDSLPKNKTISWRADTNHNKQFPVDPRKESPYQELLNHLKKTKQRSLLVAETPGRREALNGVLSSYGMNPTSVDTFHHFINNQNITLGVSVGAIDRGLSCPGHGIELICESQLYGDKAYQRRRRRGQEPRDPETIIKSLAELHVGDPVVHIEHGVGRYLGLNTLNILGEETEFLTLEYQDKDKLYIPILSLNLISRFIGGSAEHAPIHRLGGEQWEKSKKRAREKAYDVAAELLEIEAIRNTRPGNAFAFDTADYERFISQFPFEETPDQQQVIDEVIADLQSPSPMDRLVCGDVGFGKTEVALRAAFIAASNGKQVAILAPTTLLAQQHYQSFTDRFSEWAINIAVLSRFITRKRSEELVNRISRGAVDIIIGTHRLLQEDIRFADLGLLIIDEEHRFGVRQKERLKRMRSQVDILTLTATPIPRTLNITMSGLRSISFISTPPVNRLSIKTFIRQWSRSLIREACLREIRRGGQVFFLHNDVKSIDRMAYDLAELVPEAEINIGHGQMPELKLERIMQDFYHQRFNILMCSTIIESGIDIPSANTIIINRADRFGLAQLHQLRGRVGRSHHQAYAYLLIPDKEIITSNARKRLDAIDAMEDLGAGFVLASHDLEIRGAGELLGETQSGSIDDVGFSLYSEYLAQAVKAIKEGTLPDPDHSLEAEKQTNVDLHIPALFPADYLANTHSRLILYKRIANSASFEELNELQIETIDRFGLLPEQGKNLFKLTAMRLEAERLDIKKIEVGENTGLIEFYENPVVDPGTIFELIQSNPNLYQLAGPNSIKIKAAMSDAGERIAQVTKLLTALYNSPPEAR